VTTYADYGHQFAHIYDGLFPRSHVSARQVDWMIAQLPQSDHPLIVEFGVGTGRVALPVAAALAGRDLQFLGVDVSQEMLDALRRSDLTGLVTPMLADVTEQVPATGADLVLCVCATISMITDQDRQEAAFSNAAATLRPGGVLVVETHNPTLVKTMHTHGHATLAIPYEGERRVLVSFCELDFPIWNVDHCWIEGDKATFASEVSRLTSLEELDGYASRTGLELVGHFAGLDGSVDLAQAPTITAVYRRRE